MGDGVTGAERAQGELPTEPLQDSTCRVELPQFEGPLDLLLHLITKHELDIIDIPIGFITEKYLEYLSLLKVMSIDVASEYLVMAATLAHIKSKMLLPTPPPDQEDGLEEEQEDPRAELVRRLLEYQKYKAAAAELGDRSLLGADVFGRGEEEHVAPEPAPLAQVGVFSLIDAFQRIADRRKIRVDHEIDLDRISITERIGELADLLRLRGPCTIEDLLPERMGISELIITFLALLEMTRLRITRLQQSHPLASLHVALAVSEQEEQKSGQHASNDTEA
jgi:segregation and condensation protein A